MKGQITKAHITTWGSALALLGYGIYELATKNPAGTADIVTAIGLIASSFAGAI